MRSVALYVFAGAVCLAAVAGVSQAAPLAGTYTVGAAQPAPFNTLTAALGELNTQGVAGPVTFLLADSVYATGESFPLRIAGGIGMSASQPFTLRPAPGMHVRISGSNGSSILSAVFKLDGADYVTIDGSNNGTTTRDLTITGTYRVQSGVWLANTSGGDGATHNNIRNCTLRPTPPDTRWSSGYGIFSGGTSVGSAAVVPNDGNTYSGNSLEALDLGISQLGPLAAPDAGTVITANEISAPGSVGFPAYSLVNGINAVNQVGVTITRNAVHDLNVMTSIMGIRLFSSRNALIDGNTIHDLTGHAQTESSTDVIGIYASNPYATTESPSNNVVSNNIVYGLSSVQGCCFGQLGGLYAGLGYGDRMAFNSVLIDVAPAPVTKFLAALVVLNGAYSLDARDNVLAVANTSPYSALVYCIYSEASKTAGNTFDYNLYWSSGDVSMFAYYVNHPDFTLAAWRTDMGQDVHSMFADPRFVSTTNLHISNSGGTVSPAARAGVAIAGVTADIDGDTRRAQPDIGADEFVTCVLSVSGSNGSVSVVPSQPLYNPGSSVTLTATPDAGYGFVGWSGGASGSANPLGLVLTGDLSVIATFQNLTGVAPPDGAGAATRPVYRASAGTLTWRLAAPPAAPLHIELLDVAGRRMAEGDLRLATGEREATWRVGALPSGVYLLHASDGVRVSGGRTIVLR